MRMSSNASAHGPDFVEIQIRLARGDILDKLRQEAIGFAGHAIELCIYAKDPPWSFPPSPGP
jgi:acetyl/propionyl-CoA carboxylase alpha subunit